MQGGHMSYSWAGLNDLWVFIFAHMWLWGTSLARPAVFPHICWLIGNPNVQDSTGDQSRDAGLLRLETKSMWHWLQLKFPFTQVKFTMYLLNKTHGSDEAWSSGQQEPSKAVQSCWKPWPTAMFPSLSASCPSPLCFWLSLAFPTSSLSS